MTGIDPSGQGGWVFVCGPSGAGKDSVIAWAEEALDGDARIAFAVRLATRNTAGGRDGALSAREFDEGQARGLWAWHWHAHGFHYVVPAAHAADVQAGRWVVVNGSRAHVQALQRAGRRPDVRVVLVDAPSQMLARRLQARGRDDPAAVAARLRRNDEIGEIQADLTIHNDGDLDAAGAALVRYLKGLA